MKRHSLSIQDAAEMRQLLSLPGGFELHIGMFIPSILSQGTPEQQAKWMPLCMNLNIIGTYAQTELGHGTFLRGLETVAVYDPKTKSFVIHSPTLTATKWWPGGLGKTATHVILMARLISLGKDYGPHAFVVQIRDLKTHLPLSGIKVGDIGPKLGFNGVDNGWLQFDHVQVPKEAMLMRYARVEDDGTYVPPPAQNSKASYATMVYVRATIVRDAGEFLGRAATIAIRYTAVRRQSSPDNKNKEIQILDYDNIQQVLIPYVARTYALKFVGKQMMDTYESFVKARNKNDFSALPELHANSSGLKAYCTDTASLGIEYCRRTCGGHGYSVLSGLPSIYASYVQNVTWEGDNNVMYLQMARYIIKILLRKSPNVANGTAYLLKMPNSRCAVTSPEQWANQVIVVEALEHAARYLAQQSLEKLKQNFGGQSVKFEGEGWNSMTMDLITLAQAHCRILVQQAFIKEVLFAKATPSLHQQSINILEKVCALHGKMMLRESSSVLLESGYISGQQNVMLSESFKVLLKQLRPEAVCLVDSFGYDDYVLNSAIGRKDGDVYTALLSAAKSSPLNETEEGPGWDPVLRELLDSQIRSKL